MNLTREIESSWGLESKKS